MITAIRVKKKLVKHTKIKNYSHSKYDNIFQTNAFRDVLQFYCTVSHICMYVTSNYLTMKYIFILR